MAPEADAPAPAEAGPPTWTYDVGGIDTTFTFGDESYKDGDHFETADPCVMKAFVNAFQEQTGADVRETFAGAVDLLEEACPSGEGEGIGNATDAPGQVPADPDLDGGAPDPQESAEGLGPPAPDTGGTLDAGPPGPGDPDGRSTAEQLYDQRAPQSEGDVEQRLLDGGVPGDEIPALIDAGWRGEGPQGQPHPFKSDDQADGGAVADPVDLFSAAYVLREVDLHVPGAGLDFELVRVYASGDPAFGPFGFNWDHSYNVYLRELDDGRVAVWSGALREHLYEPSTEGPGFEPPTGLHARLDRIDDPFGGEPRYRVAFARGLSWTFARPPSWPLSDRIPLERVSDRHGNTLRCSYDREGRLDRVVDTVGRGVDFRYGDCGLLESVGDFAGRTVRYDHDADAEHLVAVTSPAAPDAPDGLTTRYEYDEDPPHPALRHNVVRVVDSGGRVLVENEYGEDPAEDDFNRVVRQLFLGDEHRYSATRLRYVSPDAESINDSYLRVEYRPPEDGLRVYTFNRRGNLLDERFRLVADRTYRLWAMSYRYNANGDLAAAVKPNGLALLYDYDEDAADPRDRGNLLRVQVSPSPLFYGEDRVLWELTYVDGLQELRTATDEAGATTTYVYDVDGDPLGRGTGRLVELRHPPARLPDGSVQQAPETFAYDERARLVERRTAEGHVVAYAYHDSGPGVGQLARVTVGAGAEDQAQDLEYDVYGNVSLVRLASGATYELETDALGRVVRTRKPTVDGRSAEVVSTYGELGALVAQQVPRGALQDPALGDDFVRNDFDLDVLAAEQRIVLGANTAAPREWRFEHSWDQRMTRTVDPLGRTSRLRYDERGLPLERTVFAGTPEERSERYAYDRNGNVTRHVDARGRTSTYAYDGFDRLVEESLPGPEGSRTRIRYGYGIRDQLERVEIVGVPRPGSPPVTLSLLEQRFDERGRLVARSQDGQDATLWFDGDGNVTRLRDERGSFLELEVDALGRVRRATDPAGNVTAHEYDRDGNLVAVEEQEVVAGAAAPEVSTARLSYDGRGRLTALTDPLGNATTIDYDDRDLPTALTSPLGVRHAYEFDHSGSLVYAGLAGARSGHRFDRDAGGRVRAYVDPDGAETRYEYAADDAWRAVVAPDGSTRERAFGPTGELLRERWANGGVDLLYGDDGLVQRLVFAAGPGVLPLPDLHYARDGLGRAVHVAQGGSGLELGYDAAGRLASESHDGATTRWRYDDASGTARLTYPDGRVDRYEFDALGRLSRIALERPAASPLTPPSLTAGALLAQYDYAGPERIARRRLGNGSETRYGYDAGKRLSSLDHRDPRGAVLARAEYVYDRAGRRGFVRTAPAPGTGALLDFDEASRLRKVDEGVAAPAIPVRAGQAEADAFLAAVGRSATRSYAYSLDEADFRTTATTRDGAGVTTETYAAGRLHEIETLVRTGPAGSRSYVFDHDADGRRTLDDRYAYVYDVLGRVREVREAGTGALRGRLDFDPLGRLHSIEQGGGVTLVRHFGGRAIQEDAPGAAPLLQRCFGAHMDELVLQSDGVAGRWGHQDGRLSLLAASDDAGTPAERYSYTPFGVATVWAPDGVTRRPGSAIGVAPVFGAHRALGLTGLYDARARTYDAVTGCYLQRDRRGHTDSPNPYSYVRQDPADLIDPSGEILPIIAALVIMGALAGAGYSFYDASDHPERYQGSFSFRALGNTVFGALVGAVSGMAAHAVATAAVGAAGGGAAGAGAAGALGTGSLTFAQRFVIGGTMAAVQGYFWRTGFHGLFPEYADPPSAGTMTFDYVTGGLMGPSSVDELRGLMRDPVPASFAPRAFGNTWRLMWRGRWLSRLTGGLLGGRYKYSPLNTFFESRIGREGFVAVSKQYWRSEAEGRALHHAFISQRAWLPRWLEPIRNAQWNLLETGGAFNTWMGTGPLRDLKERVFRGAVGAVLGLVGYGSYQATSDLLDAQHQSGPTGGLGLDDGGDPTAAPRAEGAGVPGAVGTVANATAAGSK